MKPILHIVKDPDDLQAMEVIENQAKDNAYGVTVVFIEGGKSVSSIENVRTYLLSGNKGCEGDTPVNLPNIESVDYKGLIDLIFSVESITVW